MRIPANDLIKIFRQMYDEHWTYEYGAARKGCVDCSGAFVYAYRQFGLEIAHGSNAIARRYVSELQPVSKAKPGDAAFKIYTPESKSWNLPATYKDSHDQNDYYHIGLVDDTGEFVLNALGTKAGFTRTPITKWSRVADLNAVVYADKPPISDGVAMLVSTPNGGKVNVRPTASTAKAAIDKLPNGYEVEILEDHGDWVLAQYRKEGFICKKYLEVAQYD